MLRTTKQRVIARLVLANYLALLSFGECFHDHGCEPFAPDRGGCSTPLDHDCSHAEPGTSCDGALARWERTNSSPTARDADGCLVCQFLTKKSASVALTDAVIGNLFDGNVRPVKCIVIPKRFLSSQDIRGPPDVA